jgi:hypothetical protein
MFSYFYKLAAAGTTDYAPMVTEPNFAYLEAALERAYWHARLPAVAYRFGYILSEQRGTIVMDAARFQRWLTYRLAVRREAV